MHGNVTAHARGESNRECNTSDQNAAPDSHHHALSMRRAAGAGAGAAVSPLTSSAGLNCSHADRVVMVSTTLNCSSAADCTGGATETQARVKASTR